jgi:hypothetical protein
METRQKAAHQPLEISVDSASAWKRLMAETKKPKKIG